MKTKICKTLFLLTLFTLVSCGTSSSVNNSIDNSSVIDIGGEANIKNVVKYLKNCKRYTVNTAVMNKNGAINYESYYSEEYYYSTFDLSGYAQDENGVFKLDNYNGDFVSSELLTDKNNNYLTDMWESGLFISFANININNFDSTSMSANVSNKEDKLYLLDMLKVSRGILTGINQFDISLDSSNNLTIEIVTTNSTYSATVNYQSDLFFQKLDRYLSVNSYYKTTDEEKYLQACFAADNYERVVYNTDGNTIAGWEHFTPNYFYGEYTKETEKENNVASSGYICLKNFSANNTVYNGMYYFFFNDNGIGLTLVSEDTSYDINSFMNYPSNLLALSSLQFFTYNESSNEYVTVNKEIADDFLENFQIKNMFQGQSLVATGLSYKTENVFSKKYTVTFSLSFTIDSSSAYMEFEFVNFGSANIEKVDETFNF